MLRARSQAPDDAGTLVRVDMQYVGFEALRFDGRVERREEGRETCVVLLSGHASLLGLLLWGVALRIVAAYLPARR